MGWIGAEIFSKYKEYFYWNFIRYTEAVMVARPSIYISLAELTDTHQLLLDHRYLCLLCLFVKTFSNKGKQWHH